MKYLKNILIDIKKIKNDRKIEKKNMQSNAKKI